MKSVRFFEFLAASLLLAAAFSPLSFAQASSQIRPEMRKTAGIKNAADFGFLPSNDGVKNAEALQRALDGGGTVGVFVAGTYDIAKTVFLDSRTRLVFGADTFVRKVAQPEKFCHVFVNRGASTKTWNERISIEGLNLIVNGVDSGAGSAAVGLRAQIAFFYVRDVSVKNFRCYDLGSSEFCIQICTFENATIDDAVIFGKKDGVHFGRGKTFRVSNCVFKTFDDAIALNAHDYSTSNPELGWIEDGVIENITDLDDSSTTGYFCRVLAGAWTDWRENMQIRRSDSVVADGKIYRSVNKTDGKTHISKFKPAHEKGIKDYGDGVLWTFVQEGSLYTAGVRNIVFRDIFIYKRRVAFSVHFDNDNWSRSYYPDSAPVCQKGLLFDNVRILHDAPKDFLSTKTPIDVLIMRNCFLRSNQIRFISNSDVKDFGTTFLRMENCVVDLNESRPLIVNKLKNKKIDVRASGTIVPNASPTVEDASGAGRFDCDFLTKRQTPSNKFPSLN